MPSITFVLPHWFYWAGLLCFPIVAMVLTNRTFSGNRKHPYSKFISYFILFCGGFLGLHRFYLRKVSGFLFCLFFAVILYSSSQENLARIVLSDIRAQTVALENSLKRNQGTINRENEKVERLGEELQELTEEDSSYRRIKRSYDRATKKIEDLTGRMENANEILQTSEADIESAEAVEKSWGRYAFYGFLLTLLLLLYDVIRIPKWVRYANSTYQEEATENTEVELPESDAIKSDESFVSDKGIRKWLDLLSLYSGYFVAYWSVIAVFVYYYEVFMRYVFNSPTNWAHESMFLMFGMQYLVAGAYAYLTESHVRVDIFYAKFSARRKAFVDILTSVFFFIFAGTLVWTSLIFAIDSTYQSEVSFTEWAIQYWPVKIVMVLGAAILLLQGVSKLLKDFDVILRQEAS